jgi:hypothetical protein
MSVTMCIDAIIPISFNERKYIFFVYMSDKQSRLCLSNPTTLFRGKEKKIMCCKCVCEEEDKGWIGEIFAELESMFNNEDEDEVEVE